LLFLSHGEKQIPINHLVRLLELEGLSGKEIVEAKDWRDFSLGSAGCLPNANKTFSGKVYKIRKIWKYR
jgi:hypothetical protein